MTAKKRTKKSPKVAAKKFEAVPIRHHLRWRVWFAIGSFVVLLASTFIWSLLAARVHQSNADQLVNTFLFHDWQTFQGALFPSAHTFLLKWPLFWIVQLCGASAIAMQSATVAITLITVSCLAYILFRIERRPLELGVLLLALASVLMLVPAQPYAGGLLPVNMAMLATRNIEYILFIIGICAFVRWPSYKRPGFWFAVAIMGLLVASDRLFATLAIGGALAAMVVYGFTRHKRLRRLALWLLIGSFLAVALSVLMLAGMNASGLTHVSTQDGGPFSFVSQPKDVALGIIFGALGVATNFGANPVFDAATFKQMPHALHTHVLSLAGPAFIVNFTLLALGVWAMVRIVLRSLTRRQKTKHKMPVDLPVKTSLFLIWSSVAAITAFVITKHYYYVDARYETIVLFGAVISAATLLRSYHFRARWLYVSGVVLLCSVVFGLFGAVRNYNAEVHAMQPYNNRDAFIAEALKHHPVDVVVGDYWRVLPLKNTLPNVQVMPLDSCTQIRHILSSNAWQPSLKQKSFAYILSFDKSLTNYPSCSLQQALHMYGQPDFSVLIAGKLDKPQETVLFYTPHQRVKHTANRPILPPSSVVLPINLQQYPFAACSGGSTVMNIVAHQDDDLLFLSPDLITSIRGGDCVRTVYITAGDAGSSKLYWLAREHGSQAAYNSMTNNTQPWVERTVKLNDNQFFTIANPAGNPKYSLIFMHLPDGNVNGQGFRASHNESLARLYSGQISTLGSVDGQSSYGLDQLESALQQMIDTFKPTQIRTQAPYNESAEAPDHSDHITVGKIVENTYQQFGDANRASISYYVGYPVRAMPNNLSGPELASKAAAFFAYAQYDPATCQTMQACNGTVYGAYLHHQLTTSEYEQ